MSIPQFSPPQMHHNLDPNLMPQMQMPNMQQMPNPNQTAQLPQRMRGVQAGQMGGGNLSQGGLLQPGMPSFQGQQNMWQGDFGVMPDGQSPSDTWSNSSQAAVPTTLNVEDWFQFFGINGDLSGMNGDVAPLA